MGLVSELRRRNVFRVAIAYVLIAWVTLEAGDVLAPALRLPEWVVSALVFFLVLGFPLALVFAWAFELTPEGIRLEKHVDRSRSTTRVTGRKLDYVIIAVLALALVLFAFDKFVLEPSRDAEMVRATTEAQTDQTAEIAGRSIAVLAFADLSPEGDQEYFSDGISEELLNVLARVPGLRVAARTSSFKFKGDNRDIIDIGRQLNVGFVLEGSVRKAGSQLRITAQLVNTENGFHIWSQTYDRDLKDIFALQDEISATIVAALGEHLGLQAQQPPRVYATGNTRAHDAFLRGRYLVVQRTPASIEDAIREFENAIGLDPNYALAHAELAIANLMLRRIYYGHLTDEEATARATPHVERALAIDPTLAQAHGAAGILMWVQRDLEEAQTHYEQAIQINPNYALAYSYMGMLLDNGLGEYVESFAMRERGALLDPLSFPAQISYVAALVERNRLIEANRVCEKLVSISPQWFARCRDLLTSLDGNWANGVLARLDHLRVDPESTGAKRRLSNYFARIGLEEEALGVWEYPFPFALSMLGRPDAAVAVGEARLTEEPTRQFAKRNLGWALAGAGDYGRARPILEEMWQESGRRVTGFGLFQHYNVAALIAIRRDAGEEAEVFELMDAMRENVRRYREIGTIRAIGYWYNVDFEEGIANFLSGKRDRGLALIAEAVEDGFFILPNEAYLRAIYDDPGFAPIRAAQEARQVRERQKVLAVVCIDNPYKSVWQPAEGTCEKFAPEGGW